MKLWNLLSAISLAAVLTGCVSPGKYHEIDKKAAVFESELKNEKALRSSETASMKILFEQEKKMYQSASELRIKALENELAASREKQKTMVDVEKFFSGSNYQTPDWVVSMYLTKIALPKNPTSQQVREFLAKITRLSNSNIHDREQIFLAIDAIPDNFFEELCAYSNHDPVRRILQKRAEKLSKDKLRSLLPIQNGWYTFGPQFLRRADASDKDFLLENFMQNQVRETLIRLGFKKEVLAEIEKRVKNGSCSYNNNRDLFYWYLKNIPEEQSKTQLEILWKTVSLLSKNAINYNWEYANGVLFCAQEGILPAFHVLAKLSNSMRSNYQSQLFTMTGIPHDAFAEWYYENKDNIVFDKATQKYIVKKAQPSK